MKKYWVSTRNSPWGVLKDGQGNMYYQHIPNFPDNDEGLRFKFLKDECNFDPEKLKNQTLEQADPAGTADQATFSVNLMDYADLGWSEDDLLRKDFLIMYDPETDKFSYWAIEGRKKGRGNTLQFEFVGTRDWLFELGFNNMFRDDRMVVIERAMTDNIITEKGKPNRWNIETDSDNSYPEPFDTMPDGTYKPTQINKDEKDYTDKIEVRVGTGTEKPSQVEIDTVNYLMNKLGSVIVKFQTKKYKYNDGEREKLILDYDKTDENKIIEYSYRFYQINGENPIYYPKMQIIRDRNNITLDYNVFVTPHNLDYEIDPSVPRPRPIKLFWIYEGGQENEMPISTFEGILGAGATNAIYNKIVASPFIYQITESPYNFLDKYVQKIIIRRGSSPTAESSYHLQINGRLVLGKYYKDDKNEDETKNDYLLVEDKIKDYDYTTAPLNLNNADNYNKDIKKDFLPTNIGKLYKSNYEKHLLKTAIGNSIQIIQDYVKDEVNISMGYTYSIDNNHTYYKINDINGNENAIYNFDFKHGIVGEDINSFSYLQTNDAFNEYSVSNKQSINQNSTWQKQQGEFIRKQNKFNIAQQLLGIVGSGISFAGGAATGNPMAMMAGINGMAGGVAGIGQSILENKMKIASNENDIKMLAANLQDTQNSPNQLIGNGDDLVGVIARTPLKASVIKYELQPALFNMIAWHFQMFGVNMGSIPRNINEYIDTRYYFNYIQSGSALENWKPDAPNSVRQIIDKSLRNGFTVWHYRDPKTFKGIKNYNVNNVEMKFIQEGNNVLSAPLGMEL